MKVLTTAQMREVDRRTIEGGIPGVVLMENAGHRVVELLAEVFAPLAEQRVTIICGKGNNGGDGMVVARQLYTRFRPRSLDVVLLAAPEDLKGDAAANYRMLLACGCPVWREVTPGARLATVVVDALLGTGLSGAASGAMLNAIREINTAFPLAKVVAVDIPSGMPGDSAQPLGEYARADYTVTFTAPKPAHVLAPNCSAVGELRVGAIGTPPEMYEADAALWFSLVERACFRAMFAPRAPGSHKGNYGHVLIIGGSRGLRAAAAPGAVPRLLRDVPARPDRQPGGAGAGGARGVRGGDAVGTSARADPGRHPDRDGGLPARVLPASPPAGHDPVGVARGTAMVSPATNAPLWSSCAHDRY
jgi:NAD(P)H-hydrate epimerase